MKILTVAIQVDALRHDYISRENTPFLYSLGCEGIVGALVPTFGFEPDAAYLAGLYPDECDGGMHFWYSPETSTFKIAKFLPGFIDSFPGITQLVLRRLLRIYVRRRTNSSRVKYVPFSCRIPFKLMPYFDLAEKYLLDEDEFADGKSIFTILRKNSKSFFFHGAPTHPTGAEAVLKGLVEAEHPFDFIYLHIGDLDSVGHKYGPHSHEISSALRRVDVVLEKIWNYLNNEYEKVNFVIFGDHGMVEVKDSLDIASRFKILNLRLGKDYLYFLDSTFARFWFFNDKTEQIIHRALEGIDQGHVLTQEEKERYHLNYSHNRFGDLIFLADPGVLIFPNFWNNSKPEKGMHGYATEYPGQQSALVIHSPRVRAPRILDEPVDMRRVFPTVLDLLEPPIPQTTTVTSLLQRS